MSWRALALTLLLCVSAPAETELGWRKSFAGIVVALGEGQLELRTAGGERLVFDIVEQTEAVPSEMAVRVGCRVEIVATGRRLLRVEVIPLSDWLRDGELDD